LKKLLRNRSATAEIVGTVLFLVILFFFFSNVFLWYNQASREMNQELADKANSALRIETVALPNTKVAPVSTSLSMGQGGSYSFQFDTGNETLIADLRLSIYANFIGSYNDSVFVQILDCNHTPVNTGLRILNGPLTWSNLTLPSPRSYIDGDGNVTVKIVDASSQSDSPTLNIGYMAVYADTVALEVTNIGGTDATLSRIWIVNATQAANGQTDHVYADLNGIASGDKLVVGGSTRPIMLSDQTVLAGDGSILVNDVPAGNLTLNYAPPANHTVTFRVLSTLGNTAACTYDFS
jgi:hypothetical protein